MLRSPGHFIWINFQNANDRNLGFCMKETFFSETIGSSGTNFALGVLNIT